MPGMAPILPRYHPCILLIREFTVRIPHQQSATLSKDLFSKNSLVRSVWGFCCWFGRWVRGEFARPIRSNLALQEEEGGGLVTMLRTAWLGSAASRGLLPCLHLHQTPAPRVLVQCCADVHAMRLVEKEYAELELNSIQVGGVRVRQHVNPFKASLTIPTVPPAWEHEFADPMLPLHVDIGCGSGRLLMVLAKRSVGSCNFLGIDIRDKLLQRSTVWAEELSLTNVHFMVANATIALNGILLKYPGPLRLVSILCPDPHFKQKHRKRRIVQKSLVEALEKQLSTGGQIFLQSDVEEVAKDMRDQFDGNANFARVHLPGSAMCDSEGWLLGSPLAVATEREIHALANGGRIFRLLFQRTSSAAAA